MLGILPHLVIGNHGAEWPDYYNSPFHHPINDICRHRSIKVELFPMETLTKAEALLAAMRSIDSGRAVYFGGNVPDEEAFQMKNANIFGVHVGGNGQTTAPYYLNEPSEVLGLLNSMVGMLEQYPLQGC